MREVLRVGVYELMELGLADHAIGGHVDVAKALGQPHLGGFVNGEPLSPIYWLLNLAGVIRLLLQALRNSTPS